MGSPKVEMGKTSLDLWDCLARDVRGIVLNRRGREKPGKLWGTPEGLLTIAAEMKVVNFTLDKDGVRKAAAIQYSSKYCIPYQIIEDTFPGV